MYCGNSKVIDQRDKCFCQIELELPDGDQSKLVTSIDRATDFISLADILANQEGTFMQKTAFKMKAKVGAAKIVYLKIK